MNLHHTPAQPTAHPLHLNEDAPRLQAGGLLLARCVWIVGVIAVLVIFFASLTVYYSALHTVIAATGSDPSTRQLTPDDVLKLHALGLSVDFYAAYNVIVEVIFVFTWFVVASIIFWRKSDDRLALFTSFTLVLFPVGFNTVNTILLPPTWSLAFEFVNFLGGMSISLFFYVFPDGRFVPHWTRWLLIVWIIYEGSHFFAAFASFNPLVHYPLLETILFIGLLISLVSVQIYRYRRVSTQVQRQQTKWVVFGIIMAIVGFVGVIVLKDRPIVQTNHK